MLCNITTRIKSLALGNACKVHFRKYSHKNYDQVMMQKKFLISEIPRIFFKHKCPMQEDFYLH